MNIFGFILAEICFLFVGWFWFCIFFLVIYQLFSRWTHSQVGFLKVLTCENWSCISFLSQNLLICLWLGMSSEALWSNYFSEILNTDMLVISLWASSLDSSWRELACMLACDNRIFIFLTYIYFFLLCRFKMWRLDVES